MLVPRDICDSSAIDRQPDHQIFPKIRRPLHDQPSSLYGRRRTPRSAVPDRLNFTDRERDRADDRENQNPVATTVPHRLNEDKYRASRCPRSLRSRLRHKIQLANWLRFPPRNSAAISSCQLVDFVRPQSRIKRVRLENKKRLSRLLPLRRRQLPETAPERT